VTPFDKARVKLRELRTNQDQIYDQLFLTVADAGGNVSYDDFMKCMHAARRQGHRSALALYRKYPEIFTKTS